MENEYTSQDFSTLVTKSSVTVTFKGEVYTFKKESVNYQLVVNAIKEGRWNDLPDLLSPAKVVEVKTHGDMVVEDGQVYVNGPDGRFAVPSGLNDTILLYLSEDLPFQPLVKFAVNLSQNPSARSVDQLFEFIQRHQMTITENGCFIAYKRVRENFTDCHTGTFDNSVGQVVKMPRNQVMDDPDVGCSSGLHVAAYNYAHHFYGGEGHVVYVEVNPKDVVSVPRDYNFEKMRVCEYKVLGLSKGEMKEALYKEPMQTGFIKYGNDLDEEYDDDDDDLDDDCSDCNGCNGSCLEEDEEDCNEYNNSDYEYGSD